MVMKTGAEPPIGERGHNFLLFACTRIPSTMVHSGSLSGSCFYFLDPRFVAFLCLNLGTGIMIPSSVFTVALEMMPGLTVEVEGPGSADVFPSCSLLAGAGPAVRGLSAWLLTSS